MNLDENYSAATKLSAWWKQVKSNFAAIGTEIDKKVSKTDYAGTDTAGVIKLASTAGGVNNSGLVVFADGSTAVNVRPDRGIKRDGAGQIGTNPATQSEVNDGTDEYKPVVPKTLKAVMDRLPSFEASEFEEFGSEYKGGSMRYLYTSTSRDPKDDHLYIYNDKPANSDMQPDGTVGTPVGWVELAFLHDVEKAAQAWKIAYTEAPVNVGTWKNGAPVTRLYVDIPDVKNSDYVSIYDNSEELCFDIDQYLISFGMGSGEYKVLAIELVCSDDVDNYCYKPVSYGSKYAYFSRGADTYCYLQIKDFGGSIIGHIDVAKIS